MRKLLFVVLLLAGQLVAAGQIKDTIVEGIVKEATENSQLEMLGHELFDKIGPRLVGSPQMKQANDWAVKKYEGWGISARNEQWGEWRGWERGSSHIDMIYPRVKTLEGTQLAWSPSTGGKVVIGEIILLPDVADSLAFQISLISSSRPGQFLFRIFSVSPWFPGWAEPHEGFHVGLADDFQFLQFGENGK